jgi:cystathionine beta-lyase/cystathionine gamma-synthase
VSWVKPGSLSALEAAIRPETRMIWVETPTNPLLKLADLEEIAGIARRHKLISVADNTFASPVIQRPLAFGFDIVVHSATKYLNGHPTLSPVLRWWAITRRWQSSLVICKTPLAACSIRSVAF